MEKVRLKKFKFINLKKYFFLFFLLEIWVLLLEKAWAKLNGNYENIERGYNSEALRDLTGAPTLTLHTLDENNKIKEKFYD